MNTNETLIMGTNYSEEFMQVYNLSFQYLKEIRPLYSDNLDPQITQHMLKLNGVLFNAFEFKQSIIQNTAHTDYRLSAEASYHTEEIQKAMSGLNKLLGSEFGLRQKNGNLFLRGLHIMWKTHKGEKIDTKTRDMYMEAVLSARRYGWDSKNIGGGI